jgi:hypothetical protein
MYRVAIVFLTALLALAARVIAPQASAPTPTVHSTSVSILEQDNAEPVAWHASYDEALSAARASGKPVMLFQLLGKLDDALC